MRSLRVACVVLACLVVAVPSAGAQSPPAVDLDAPRAEPVQGVLSGSAAERTAASLDGFAAARRATLSGPARSAGQPPPTFTHGVQGTALLDIGDSTGAAAVHTVHPDLRPPDRYGNTIATPTLFPPGDACVEVSTLYTANGPMIGGWGWCDKTGNFDALLPVDANFVAQYTDGAGHYGARVVKTEPYTWQAELYDYRDGVWRPFWSQAGAPKGGVLGWDRYEVYSDLAPDGSSYACAETKGRTFESTEIRVRTDGEWVPATAANADTRFDTPAEAFHCPGRSFEMVNQYDHWRAVG